MSWVEEKHGMYSDLKKFSYILDNKKIIKIFGKENNIWVCTVLAKDELKNHHGHNLRFPIQEKLLEVAKLKSLLKAKELGWKIKSII